MDPSSSRLFLTLHLVLFCSSNQVWSYNRYRHPDVQEDLNKLYDTRPSTKNPYGQSGANNPYYGHGGDKDRNAAASHAVPTFDLSESGDVTAVLHKPALLNCRVKSIGNKTVSWLRHRDTRLLTIGRLTYTPDVRFRAIHKIFSEDYLLEIKPVRHRDAGKYECQISTTPPTSHVVNLVVAEPHTEILGGPDIHLKEGSTMNLTCVITDSPEPPTYIFWRHNDAIISYDSPRGGVSVITDKGDEVTASFLVMQYARPSDSGTYSCSPSLGDPVSVNVHVLRGEYIGARTGAGARLLPAAAATPFAILASAFAGRRR